MDQLVYRGAIYHMAAEGKSPKEIHRELMRVHGGKAPHYSTVARWFNNNKWGRQTIANQTSPGRPAEVATGTKIKRAATLIKKNPKISTLQLSLMLRVSEASTKIILQEHLGYKKFKGKWVPHALTSARRASPTEPRY